MFRDASCLGYKIFGTQGYGRNGSFSFNVFFGLHHLLLTKPEAWSTATDPPGGWGVARRGDGSYKLLVLHRCDQGKSDQTQGHSIILYFLHEMESLETNLAAPTTKHRSGTSATW